MKKIITGTMLSILFFFSTSFLTVVHSIRNQKCLCNLIIGFPYEYYGQCYAGNPYVNGGGSYNHLLYDILIHWIVITGGYLLYYKIKSKKSHNNI